MYFINSPKKDNPFYGYDKVIRKEKVFYALKVEEEEYYEDEVEALTEFYIDYLKNASPSKAYYESTLEAADKLKKFFTTVDLSKVNRMGTPIYKPADITRALQDTDKILTTLFNLKTKVDQELFDGGKTIKNREINPFESGSL